MKVGAKHFPVDFDAFHARDVRILRRLQGGVIAYGRWMVLLGILYQADGLFSLDEMAMMDLMEELEMEAGEVELFLSDCAKLGMISQEHLSRGIVASDGVCRQLAYIEQQREHGRKGGRKGTPKG